MILGSESGPHEIINHQLPQPDEDEDAQNADDYQNCVRVLTVGFTNEQTDQPDYSWSNEKTNRRKIAN